MSNLLTHSRKSCAMTCLRKHFYQYELGVRPVEDGAALRFGSAIHEGLDHYARYGDQETAVQKALKLFDEGAVGLSEEKLDKYLIQREQISRLLYGYWWCWEADGIKTIESEIAFQIPIINENGNAIKTFQMAGKIDKIVELPDGRLAVMEHKTTSMGIEPGSNYRKKILIDTQIAAYQIAAKELGYDVDCIIYDMIGKPGISPKKLKQGDTADFMAFGKYFDVEHEICRVNDRIIVDGIDAEVIPGKKVDAIKETIPMYGDRLTAEIGDNPDKYYAREESTRLACDEQEMRFEILQSAQLLADCQRLSRWPKNTASCIGFGTCPYLDICHSGGLDADSPLPEGFVRLDNVHPELE